MLKLIAVLGGIVAVLAVVLVLLLALADPSADLALEGAKTVMTLIIAVLVTGVLSAVLAQRATNRAELEDRKGVMVAALRNLKAGCEQVELARFFVAANRTATTVIEQIPRLIDARSSLHLVQRERFLVGTEIDDRVQNMLVYLADLADEYMNNWQTLAEAALREERARKQYIDGMIDAPPEQLPLNGALFPRLFEFGQPPNQWEHGVFDRNYQIAKGKLRDWLTESRDYRLRLGFLVGVNSMSPNSELGTQGEPPG